MLSVNRKTMQHSWRTSDSTKSAIEGCAFDQRMEYLDVSVGSTAMWK